MAEITDAVLSKFSGIVLDSGEDLDALFLKRTGGHFLDWVNANLAGKGSWVKIRQVASDLQAKRNFHEFWDNIPLTFGGEIGFVPFAALATIVCNETGGTFAPITEKPNRPTSTPPGIAYWFNKIEGLKLSYNTLAGNRTARACFNDPVFIGAHGALAQADRLTNTTDARWDGETYPAGEFPILNDPAQSGFILQADFAKFRGRGLIQTTGRGNYRGLVQFIKNYEGHNATVDMMQAAWSAMTIDQALTSSTNEHWDMLFQQSMLEVASQAIALHNGARGKYLSLGTTAAQLNGGFKSAGSLAFMGHRISGGEDYAKTFAGRVSELLAALP